MSPPCTRLLLLDTGYVDAEYFNIVFKNLKYVGGKLATDSGTQFINNGNMSLPSLQSVGEEIYMTSSSGLTYWHMPALRTVGVLKSVPGKPQGMRLDSLPDLVGVNLDSMEAIDGNFDVTGLSSLLELVAPRLKTVGQYKNGLPTNGGIYFHINPKLRSIAFPALTRVANIFIKQNRKLRSMAFPALTRVGQSFGILDNWALTADLTFTSLQTIGGDLEWYRNGVQSDPGHTFVFKAAACAIIKRACAAVEKCRTANAANRYVFRGPNLKTCQ